MNNGIKKAFLGAALFSISCVNSFCATPNNETTIYQLAYTSESSLEFIKQLTLGPLKEAFEALQGRPVKDYPLQMQPDGSVAITISQKLTGTQHAEFDRTALGLVQLYAIMHDDRDLFPGLSDDNFHYIQQYIFSAIKIESAPYFIPQAFVDPDKLEALGVLLGIHDLAKIIDFDAKAKEAAARHGVILDVKDHDEVAWTILTSKNQPLIEELYPSFAGLNQRQQDLILGGLAGGINPGRIYQLEGTPGEFSQVTRHGAHSFEAALYAAFHILDIGSIRGNAYVVEGEPLLNQAGKRADIFWNDFTIRFMPPILDIAGQVASKMITPVQAYNKVIDMRAKEFNLNPEDDTERAAIRLCAMILSRFPQVTAPEVQEVLAFLKDNNNPENQWKVNLIKELNTTGYDGTPSICLGYAPDVASKIANGMKEEPDVTFTGMLEVFTKSLNNCFMAGRMTINNDEDLRNTTGQITIELEKLHPQLVNGNHRALYDNLPVLIRSGDGFVAELASQPFTQ